MPKEVVPTLSKSAATSAVLLAGFEETMLKVKSTAEAVAGVSKFAMRYEPDRANSEPSAATSGAGCTMLSADTASNSKDPKLVVTHAVAADIQAVNGVALASIQAINNITSGNAQELNGITF